METRKDISYDSGKSIVFLFKIIQFQIPELILKSLNISYNLKSLNISYNLKVLNIFYNLIESEL